MKVTVPAQCPSFETGTDQYGPPSDHRSTDEAVKGTVMEVKNVDLQQEIQRAIVRQSDAEREGHLRCKQTQSLPTPR
jgi:hypothetical protein